MIYLQKFRICFLYEFLILDFNIFLNGQTMKISDFKNSFSQTIIFLVIILLTLSGTLHAQEIPYRLKTIDPHQLSLEGHVGTRTDQILKKRVLAQDYDYLVEPFRHRTETRLWQMEFWGKWMLGAVAAWEYSHDATLMDHMDQAVKNLIATQTSEGYIGNYAPGSQLKQWDIWGRKYVMLGLLRYHDITGNKKALKAARKEADYLLTQVGPGKVNIIETGNYHGMASSSVLEPVMMLYNKTKQEKYLDFAKYIVRQWETPEGPQLIAKALAGVHVADRFPHPKVWFSPENGQKAYEMMSCYDGLLELYRVTGNPDYLKAVEMTVQDIMKEEINVAGSGTSFECWYHGKKLQTLPTYHTMETCVMTTWMKLNYSLLRLTGKPEYANHIETTYYNALQASTKYDGTEITMYSPLIGHREPGARQCGMDMSCCSANGPRGYMMIPRYAVMTGQNGIYINLYNGMTATATLGDKNKVTLIQHTIYPVGDLSKIEVTPDKPETFTIALRIPEWSKKTTIYINGKETADISPGSYKKITRRWQSGDVIEIRFDLRGRLVRLNHQVAILRGPIALARDSRFGDGHVDEAIKIPNKNGYVELIPVDKKPQTMWMGFTVQAKLGTGISATANPPHPVHLCDFGSAGNEWKKTTRYRVWLPVPLNVMEGKYESYF